MVPQNPLPDTPNAEEPAHRLNLSLDRTHIALSWLYGNADSLALVTHDARLLAALGLLICDDAGRIAEASLDSAMRDPDAIYYAGLLVSEVFD